MVTPQTIIESLTKSGMTEDEIVEALKANGVEVTQATINRIKNGVTRKPSFELGMGLLQLHARRFSDARYVGVRETRKAT